jgi:hypothetical protein
MTGNGPQPGSQTKQGVTLLPPKGTNRSTQSAKQSVAILPPKVTEHLTADQLLLCRHLVEAYRGNETVTAENAELANMTISAIDAAMVALTTAAAIAATPAPAPASRAVVAPPRTVVAGSRSAQGSASVTPRRVARPGPPLPPVVVTMDAGGRPAVVQTDLPPVVIQTGQLGEIDENGAQD